MKDSKIQWTDHTFNPWTGCSKISPACDHCYAEAWAKRAGHAERWRGERARTSAGYWRQPLKWQREAAESGVRRRVFCASLADVFDNVPPPAWRADLFALIKQTPNLDWLLLTKRIGNATGMIDAAVSRLDGGMGWREKPWHNIWLGATVVTQEEADRDIPKLLATPAARRFLSIEPMLEAIDLRLHDRVEDAECCGEHSCEYCDGTGKKQVIGLHWAIVGGESGPGARDMDPVWARSISYQCEDLGLAFFMKQMGGAGDKRGELEDLPEDLRVREFPG